MYQNTPYQSGSNYQSGGYQSQPNEMRGADIIAEYLVREKVPYILGYAGHGAIGLLDGIYSRTDRIRHISPRIEQCAGFMADVYFRLTRQPLAVYASTGPGPMNMMITLANAYYDNSAFFLITGQVPTTQIDSGALQDDYRYRGDMSGHLHAGRQKVLAHPQGRGPVQGAAGRVLADPHRPAGPGPSGHPLRPLHKDCAGRGAGAAPRGRAGQLAHARVRPGGRARARPARWGPAPAHSGRRRCPGRARPSTS